MGYVTTASNTDYPESELNDAVGLLMDRASRFIWELDCGGTGSVKWEWLPILKQSLIQTPVQFSRDPYVVEIPGRMGICMPYVVYPINSSRVFVRELFYIQIA